MDCKLNYEIIDSTTNETDASGLYSYLNVSNVVKIYFNTYFEVIINDLVL